MQFYTIALPLLNSSFWEKRQTIKFHRCLKKRLFKGFVVFLLVTEKKWKFSSEILNLTKLICKFISLFMFHLKIFLHRITFFLDILFQNQRTVANCDEENIYWFSKLNLRGPVNYREWRAGISMIFKT